MANEVAVKQDKATNLVAKLEQSFTSALPSHVAKEQFSRALLTEFRRTPGLLECDSQTLGSGVLTCAQLGLMIGVNGQAWLVPFNNRKRGGKEAVLFIGFQGMVDLCYRSDRVESIFADVVCENDEFEFVQGLDQKLRHVPNLRGDRGKPYAVYATACIKGSTRPVYVILNQDEVMAVKKASPGARSSDSPWNGEFEAEMWKKTAIRRLTKFLPKSVELANALEFENKQAERLKEVVAEVVNEGTPAQQAIMAKLKGDASEDTGGDQEPEQEPVAEIGETCSPCPEWSSLQRSFANKETRKHVETAMTEIGVEKFGDIDPSDDQTCQALLLRYEELYSSK